MTALKPDTASGSAREVSVDYFKSYLVIGMIFAHTISLLCKDESGAVAAAFHGLVVLINLISFSGFFFCFGYVNYKSYFTKPYVAVKHKMFYNAGRILLAYYVSAFASAILLSNFKFDIERTWRILSFGEMPGFSEFLISFALVTSFSVLLFKTLVKLIANDRLLISLILISLLSTFLVPYRLVTDNRLGLITGSTQFTGFPVLQYLCFFLTGIFFAKKRLKGTWRITIIALGISVPFFIAVIITHHLPSRFPPGILWITGATFVLYLYYLISIKSVTWFGEANRLLTIGHNTLFYLILSNVFLFSISAEIKAGVSISVGLMLYISIMAVIYFLSQQVIIKKDDKELITIRTDYQLTRKEMLELKDDLNNYFRSNVNGQLIVDNHLVLLRFSPGAMKFINLLESDLGRPLSSLLTNWPSDDLIKDIEEVFEDGTPIIKEVQTDAGDWFQVITTPYIQLADNQRNGAIITLSDIAALKKTQVELDRKNDTLLRISADMDSFANTVVHDLLGPLNNIELSISTMNLMVKDHKMKDYMTVINSSVKKLGNLIKTIDSVAKIENENLTKDLINIDEMVTDIILSLDKEIQSTGTTVNKYFEARQILFSNKNFRGILHNLITNAIKFDMGRPPVINLHTFMNGNEIVLTVEDNGRGMTASGLSKIFNMYGRLNQHIDRNGISLYLARKIINASGGSISAVSEVGKGSKFTLSFQRY